MSDNSRSNQSRSQPSRSQPSRSQQVNASNSDLLPLTPIDELQQLYDEAPCGYHSLDANGVFIRINQTELTMLGYDREEIIGQKRFADLLTPESQKIFATNFPQFKQQGWVKDLEFQLVRKNGNLIPVSISATAVKDAAGNYIMSRSVMIDISDRKRLEADHQQAEIALRDAHQRIVNVWESMTDAYVTLDPDWRYIYVNQAAVNVITQLTTIPADEILGKTHGEVFPLLAGGTLEARYRQAIAEQMPAHFDLLYEPTGNWFEIHAYPSRIGLGVYFRDITDRKLADQKIREQANLLAIATDAIFVHDLDNRIMFWNQGAEKLYGWSAADMIGQDWRALLSPDTASELATVIEQGIWQGEVPKITQAGKAVVVMSRRSVMLDEIGQPKSVLTVDTDITEKKQLETQFLRAQRLESLGTLASGIAHDLNNVLTPIIGIVQLLPTKVTNIDPQTKRLLQILNDSARRGADLVKQILSFTRGLEGKPTSTQVTHLLAEIQKIIRQTFPKNIELSLDLSPDLRLIAADATMLHQVLMNLCVNARDAMPNGGQLSIKTENLTLDENYARMNLDAQAGPYVVVTIADTGIGIPAEIIDRIFDPFFTTKDIGQGTGLGLSTVIGIIKSHHGFINVYSEVGKGTRFTVYLPATERSETEPIATDKPPLGHGELILVVDDESAIQEITKVTLEDHGYQVITASDGIEAIALYAEHKREISVILMDLMMPSLDSPTTIRTLLKLNPQVQIVAMSGLATNESVTKTMKEGVKSFLAKPFTAAELLNLLATILAKK
jgi:PAS domain S-box-containing protein